MKTSLIPSFTTLLDYASRYLSEDKYEHSLRVMLLIMRNNRIPAQIHDECIVVAIAHDLLEDSGLTSVNMPSLDKDIWNALNMLAHNKSQKTYVEYIMDITEASKKYKYGEIAHWVKLADMKDHLMQKNTLTDELKAKYMNAIPYLIP